MKEVHVPLLLSLAIFSVFFANVVMGAFFRNAFLGDVGEMLVLFAAVIVFVVAILRKEVASKNQD